MLQKEKTEELKVQIGRMFSRNKNLKLKMIFKNYLLITIKKSGNKF